MLICYAAGRSVVVSKMPREQIKQTIVKLFDQKKELGYSDIISQIDADLELVVEICAELEKEKKIKAID